MPSYEQQLALYVYLLRQQQEKPVQGHLVLVNLADEAQRLLLVETDSR